MYENITKRPVAECNIRTTEARGQIIQFHPDKYLMCESQNPAKEGPHRILLKCGVTYCSNFPISHHIFSEERELFTEDAKLTSAEEDLLLLRGTEISNVQVRADLCAKHFLNWINVEIR
jgi:hypothetical protein